LFTKNNFFLSKISLVRRLNTRYDTKLKSTRERKHFREKHAGQSREHTVFS